MDPTRTPAQVWINGQDVNKAFVRQLQNEIIEGIDAAEDRIAALKSTSGAGWVVKDTKAHLDLVAGPADTIGFVWNDGANNGRYVYSAGTWHAVDDDVEFLIAQSVADERSKQPSPFLATVEDEYMRALVQNVSIERGVAGREYVFRWRTDIAGGNHRLQFYVYDPIIDANICTFSLQADHDFSGELEGIAFAINASQGSPFAGYTGTSATIWFDPTKIDWTKGASNETTPAASGIRADRVLTTDQVSEMLFFGKGITNRNIYVGPDSGLDFTHLQYALASFLLDPDSARGWFPFSFTVTPSAQVHIYVVGELSEEWLENVVDQGGGTLAGQGMIVWAGINIYLQPDTHIYTTGGATYGGPLFEWSYGGRLVAPATARLEQHGHGYVFHIDAGNRFAEPATVGLAQQFYRLDFLLDGGTVWVHSGHTDWMIGRGVSDGERGYIWNQHWVREAGSVSTTSYYGSHTSPNSVMPGRISFKNIVGNADTIVGSNGEIQLLKSNVQDTRHEISIENSDIHKISMGNSAGGTSGFVRLGKLDGITVSGGSLDQA